MQEMQALFNYLFISWFGCICDMQTRCKTCKFLISLQALQRVFTKHASAIFYVSVSYVWLACLA